MLTAALLVLSLARLLQGSEVAGVGNVILQEIVNIVQNEVQHEGCRRDSLLLIQEFQNYTDWALQMVDATAKFPVGILQGNLRQLGDFDECVTASGDGIRGQYCLANLQATPRGPEWERVLHRATAGRRHLEKTRGRTIVNAIPTFARLEWAICVPSSCPAHDVQAVINAALQRLDLQIDAEVLPEACQLESNSWPQLNFADYVMIAIIVATMVLLVAGSAYDKYLERNKDIKHNTGDLEKILLAFSVPANWRKLLDTKQNPGNVGCIDGIRTLSTLWVIVAHKMLFLTTEPLVNKVMLINFIQDIHKMPLANCTLNVDTFFVISGFLRGYNMLGELQNGRFKYLSSLVQRYLRLSPPYFIMIGFYASLLMYLGSGPAWNETTGVNSLYCRESWIFNILYVNNYFNIERLCVMQSWYLSADLQLFLLAPLVLYPLWRWPTAGKLLAAGLLILSVVPPVAAIFISQCPGIPIMSAREDKLIEYMMYIYATTHNRLSPYLIGLSLGFVLDQLRHRDIALSRFWVATGWVVSSTLFLAITFGPYKMMQMDYTYNAVEMAAYGGLHRLVWGAAVAWLVFACHTGHGGIVNSILTATPFRIFSRLSYSIYLTHVAVDLFISSRIRSPLWTDEFQMVHSYLADVAIIVMASLLLHLMYEGPSLTITAIIFRKDKPVDKKPKGSTKGMTVIQPKMNSNTQKNSH
ncbi:nose resistant to fluoxetine protein 6 [Anabrus simplex]|uniref:nose resistant to fluoxetine protein 6 n=1 Tax=Anabrus simplex TaxID=316456 RepID=UPI0035A3C553